MGSWDNCARFYKLMFHESDNELVMLGECDSVQELMVVRGLLESEGIECFRSELGAIEDLKKLGDGLTLYVWQGDLAKARALLDAPVELPGAGTDTPES